MSESKTRGFKKTVRSWLMITAGSFLYGISISLFLDPNNLAPGGVTGIAVILNRLTALPTGTGMLLLNIPILLAGLWKFGLRFLISTIYATFMCSLFINLLSAFPVLTSEPLLAALAGGVFMALGLGMVFRAGATTGGTDIIVKFLRLRYRHLKTGRLFLMIDILIVSATLFVFRDVNTVLYAVIAVLVSSRVFDEVLYGRDEARLLYIISDRPECIADRILKELDAGVTYLQGKGGYSNRPRDVIMCVIRNTMAPRAEEIVKEEDPNAFLIISSAREIYGEGYKDIFAEKL